MDTASLEKQSLALSKSGEIRVAEVKALIESLSEDEWEVLVGYVNDVTLELVE